MGIRFHCPNGHRLNIKSFLAGKRGICPHCEARFIIPLASGGQATAIEDVVEPEPEPIAEAAAPEPNPAESMIIAPAETPVTPPPTQAEKEQPPEVWYVRPAKGDVQYGPASTEMIQTWIAEDRIAVDSWVWKTGWPQWKFGSEVLEEFQSMATTPAPATNNSAPAIQLEKHSSVNSVANKLSRKTPRSRQQQAQKVTVMLGALVLLLGIAVVLVLMLQ